MAGVLRGDRRPNCPDIAEIEAAAVYSDSPGQQEVGGARGAADIGPGDIHYVVDPCAFGDIYAGHLGSWRPAVRRFWPEYTSEDVCPTIVIIGHTMRLSAAEYGEKSSEK